MSRRAATAVRIHCPVAAATLAGLLAGDSGAIERDPVLARTLAVIRGDAALGQFGHYDGVAELSIGWETFRPTAGAAPTMGGPGTVTVSPTVIVTSYAPAGADLTEVVAALVEAHPWEVPVIETYPTAIVLRDDPVSGAGAPR